jgi:hypothetical protein
MRRKITRFGLGMAFGMLAIGGLPAMAAGNPQFGMVGLAAGQVLRQNVVAYPPNPCSAAIGFRNSNGQYPQPLPDKTVYLNPGQADFIDLPAGVLGLRFGQRAELQPAVALQPAPNGSSSCKATAEVYDRFSGRTWTLLFPQPKPD